MRLCTIGLILFITLPACSERQVYDGLRERERNRCAEGPAVDYEACLQRIEMDYNEYQKKYSGPE